MKMLFKSPGLWWKFEGRYILKNIKYGLKNFIKWAPIIYKDRDYDQFHIYKILQFKLEKQAYAIASRDRHVRAQRDAEVMLLCARLCFAQVEEGYENEYLDYLMKKWEFTPVGDCWEVNDTVVEDNLDEYFAKYPRQYKRVLKGDVKWYGKELDLEDREEIAMTIAFENQIRSRKLLFKIMNERSFQWWD